MNLLSLTENEIYICILVYYFNNLQPNDIKHILGIEKQESSLLLDKLCNSHYILIQNSHLCLNSAVSRTDLENIFLKLNSHDMPTYMKILCDYYTKPSLETIKIAVNTYLELINFSWGNTSILFYYNLCIKLLMEYKVNISDHDEITEFINNSCKIHLYTSIFPFSINQGIVLLFKAKALAFVQGSERLIICCQAILLTLTTSMSRTHRNKLIANKFASVMQNCYQENDQELNRILRLQLTVNAFYQGKMMPCFQLAMSGLNQCGKHSPPRLISQLYSLASAAAFFLGEYDLCENIEQKPDVNYGISLFMLYALKHIIQNKDNEFFKIIQKLEKNLTINFEYKKIWKSILFSHYFIKKNKVKQVVNLYNRNIKPYIDQSIYYSEHLMGGYFLNILLYVHIHSPNEENLTNLNFFIQNYLQGTRKPHKCAALRHYGKLILHANLNDVENATSYFQKAYDMACEFSFVHEQYLNSLQLARTYQMSKDIHKAIYYAQEAYKLSVRHNYQPFPKDLLKLAEHTEISYDDKNKKKEKLFKAIRTQVRKINIWTNIEEFIRIYLSEMTSNLGIVNLICINHQSHTIIRYGENKLGKINKSDTEILQLADLCFKEGKHHINKLTTENNTIYYSVMMYLNIVPYSQICIYFEGNLFTDIAEILDDFFIEELAQNSIDFFNTVYMCENRNQYKQNAIISSPRKNDNNLLYKSKEMYELIHDLETVAKTDASILILGESGVGKELLAKKIHQDSNKNGAFVAVNLANISDNLYESELHGYEKGAFTNALKQHIGFFELADGGTLFIDEVAEIPLNLQVKLLRVLQEKQFIRVGGTKLISSDFRLITATNRDLKKEIACGNFREDLYYRLNVIPITVPPLRSRKEDILFLAEHFLHTFSQKHNKKTILLTNEDREVLLNYAWPGNIRELKNIIERYILLSSQDNNLSLSKLIQVPLPIDSTQSKLKNNAEQEIENLFANLPNCKELENKYLEFLFKKTNGKIDGQNGMSQILKLSRQQIYNKINAAGIKEKYKKCYIEKEISENN